MGIQWMVCWWVLVHSGGSHRWSWRCQEAKTRQAIGTLKSRSVAEGWQGFYLHSSGFEPTTFFLGGKSHGPRQGLYHWAITPEISVKIEQEGHYFWVGQMRVTNLPRVRVLPNWWFSLEQLIDPLWQSVAEWMKMARACCLKLCPRLARHSLGSSSHGELSMFA
jgi:hypothetical protein